MPATKPAALVDVDQHQGKRAHVDRVASEHALMPRTDLSLAAPAILRGHSKASRTWKRIVGLYAEVDGKIATAFDADLLTKYCLLEEEVDELALMRKRIKTTWETQERNAKAIKPSAENLKDWLHMWDVVNGLLTRFQGMDARLDGKRKLLHTLAQSLYLTPRSRAGVTPPLKEPQEPQTEIDKLLNE